jgi:DNA-binding SARP family transcriptional activator
MRVEFGVLGPVVAWGGDGTQIALKGPRHRAVLARLVAAHGRVVPVSALVDDLWTVPPPGAVGALRTFIAALRRALEPERPPRAPARLLVTAGPGYALHAEPDAVDAWRFEQAVAAVATLSPEAALRRLSEALEWWRGPAYADFDDEHWARVERSRLAELRLHAVEQRAGALLALGMAAEAVPELGAHVTEHPWREDAWRLLALALYRSGRQGDALAVLRRARGLLVEQLGVDPGPTLRRLERDILDHAEHLGAAGGVSGTGIGEAENGGADAAGALDAPGRHDADAVGQVWAEAAADYDRTVGSAAGARLESTVGLLRNLAVTGGGGLEAARRHRAAAVAAAEELGDAELTARVIGAYDVPAIWTRSDDPVQAQQIVAAAERTLHALPTDAPDAARARLLATIALESRGTGGMRGPAAAHEAEEIARRLDDPTLLAFALNGVFMQSFERTGLAPRRDAIGTELIALSVRHDLVSFELLGHLIRLQARSALGDFAGADRHAAAVDRLGGRHERPLAAVFTAWYRALRLTVTGDTYAVVAAYRAAAARLDGAGMPGLERGLLPLALLSLRIARGQSAPVEDDLDWGPYEPWTRPLVLLAQDRRGDAVSALRAAPDPPRDLLSEALWCLTGRAAIALGDRATIERAHAHLAPAEAELAGAGSGLLSLGPVARQLGDLAAAARALS